MNYNTSCHIGGTVPAPAVFDLMKEWALLFWHLVRHLVTPLQLWAWKQTTLRCYGPGQWKYTFLTFRDAADRKMFFFFPRWLGLQVYTNYHWHVSSIEIIKFSFDRMNTSKQSWRCSVGYWLDRMLPIAAPQWSLLFGIPSFPLGPGGEYGTG